MPSIRRSPTPSCNYYPDRPCARPRECPVHGPILQRTHKCRHLLREGLEGFRWSREERLFHRTLCGRFLYQRPDMEAEYARIDATFADPGERFRAALALSSRPGFRYPPEPCDVPGLDVFYEVGWDRREVIVVGAKPTCQMCLRCEKAKARA